MRKLRLGMAIMAIALALTMAAATGLAESHSETIETNVVFNGQTFVNTTNVTWDVEYPVPEGGVQWDGSSEFLASADFSDIDVVDAPESDPYGDAYVKNQITFMGVENCDFYEIQNIAAKYGCRIVGYLAPTQDFAIEYVGEGTYDFLQNMVANLKDEPGILSETVTLRYAFPVATNDTIPGDPWNSGADDHYSEAWDMVHPSGRNWGLEAIHAPEAWDYMEYMRPMKVGVIDSVIQDNHEDLRAVNLGNINSNDMKEDYWYGWAGIVKLWPTLRELFESLDWLDYSGFFHGTHVAGTIAASHNNVGISGVFPKGEVVGISTYWNNDIDINDYSENFIEYYSMNSDTFQWKLYFLLLRRQGAKVINMSLGASWEKEDIKNLQDPGYNQQLSLNYTEVFSNQLGWNTFFERLEKLQYDFIFIHSSGNAGINCAMNFWPEWISNTYFKDRLLIVGAYGQTNDGTYIMCDYDHDGKSDYNYGERMEIIAPGAMIYSTIPDGFTLNDSGYDIMGGTSMAAPHVAGTAAMVWSINPSLTGAQVKQIILDNADHNHALTSGHDDDWVSWNAGDTVLRMPREYPLLDAGAAVKAAAASAGIPTPTPKPTAEPTSTPSGSTKATIRISVIDDYVIPVKDAEIMLYYDGVYHILDQKTNSEGMLTVTVDPGTYTVIFEQPGYLRCEKTVTVREGEVIDVVLDTYTLPPATTAPAEPTSTPTSAPTEKLACYVKINQDPEYLGMLFNLQLRNVQGTVTQFDVRLLNKGITIVDTMDGIYEQHGLAHTDDSWSFYVDDELLQGAVLYVTASDSSGQTFNGNMITVAGSEHEGWMPTDD